MNKAISVGTGLLSCAALMFSSAAGAAGIDAAAAQALVKENECFKCHTIDKTKKGPSYKKIAEKNRDKPDAEAKLIKHITSGQKVKLEDGSEVEHKIIEATDQAELSNLVRWILSL